MKRKIIIISLLALMLDQLIKIVASYYLTNVTLIPNFLSLVYAENTGVAFSMLSGNRMFIILITIILLGILIQVLKKENMKSKQNSKLIILSYGFLFGGILGNLLDRITRGVVIDYVSLNILGYHFPIFNLADLFITFGVILLIIKTIKEDEKHN